MSLALTILLGIALFPGAAWATCGPSWAELPSDTLVSEFHDVDAVDADTAWAVGYRFDDATQPRAVTARWDGTAWSTIPVTVEGESSDLWGVTVVAEDDVWAVGRYQELGTYETFMLIMHWDGGAWTKVAAPDANLGSLIDVDAVTADDIWAVGSEKVSGQTRGMALHWGGATWSKVSTPNPTGTTRGLRSVSARATGDVWAAGASRKDGVNKPLIERWNGS